MESSGFVPGLSFAKTLREGQRRVLEQVARPETRSLNVRLPTGYGKTFTAAAAYSILRAQGRVNRLLYVVPTAAQLDQFTRDGQTDLDEASVDNPTYITNLGYSLIQARKNEKLNRSHVFACTIQALTNERSNTAECVRDLMAKGQWMLVIDEYHHYGLDRAWGKFMVNLPYNFRLAMSATPFRSDQDEALGKPHVEVLYREAAMEGAVKSLYCHAYVYQIDAIMPDGEVRTFTTPELVKEAGSDDPAEIERLRIDRQMRWSPKYVSPLIYNPLDRLEGETRIATGLPCQALVGAMCCSHAELVCTQIQGMYPHLRVDWVGTGPDGRSEQENEALIRKFCPKKIDGERRPEDIALDVLVHVGKAGEGLDSIFVTEVIHLNPANITNQNNQENGRASRLLPDIDRSLQEAWINVDSCSPYATYAGKAIMDAIDQEPPQFEEDDGKPKERDLSELPEEPRIHLKDVTCIQIIKGEAMRMASVLKGIVPEWSSADLDNPEHPIHEAAEREYLKMRQRQAEEYNAESVHSQWSDHVGRAESHVVHRAIRTIAKPGARIERTLVGDLKRRVSQQRARLHGRKEAADVEGLKRQYQWLKSVEQNIISSGELPTWLR